MTLRPANPDVTLTPQAIVLRVPIKFRPGAPKLDAAIKAELDGGGGHPGRPPRDQDPAHRGALERRPAKGKGRRRRQEADARSRPTAIKDYLVAKGAPAERIEAVGVGGESPLVPNLGPANQAKNRRVELVVQQ